MIPTVPPAPLDSLPPIAEPDSGNLADTIVGFCNESKLTRIEVLGAIEGAKLTLWAQWLQEEEA